MALKKDIKLMGHLNNYIRILNVWLECPNKKLVVEYAIYKDKETRFKNQFDYIKKITKSWRFENIDVEKLNNTLASIYAITTESELDHNGEECNIFAGALPVLDVTE